MEHWYALNSKPHQEGRVADYLRQRPVEVYLPLVRVNPVNPRAARVRPYFPGYLFARFDWRESLRLVHHVGGVTGIVADSSWIRALRRT